jgi:hypothetical protein
MALVLFSVVASVRELVMLYRSRCEVRSAVNYELVHWRQRKGKRIESGVAMK